MGITVFICECYKKIYQFKEKDSEIKNNPCV